MRRLGIAVVCAWTLVVSGCATTVDGTAVVAGRPQLAKSPGDGDLPALLLSVDETRQLLKFDGMVAGATRTTPDPLGVFVPPDCVGAVFSGMASSYNGSRYRTFFQARQQDENSADRHYWVDQDVATFENPEAAQAFVSKQVAQWRQCRGQRFTYAFPGPDDWQRPYLIGDLVNYGRVTTISSVVEDDKRYTDIRELAAKSNVVVDLQFTGFDLTDEPATAVNRILDRIATHGHDCVFSG